MADQLLSTPVAGFIGEAAAKLALGSAGIAIPRGELAPDAMAAASAAARLGGPVVLKLVSPDVVHKTEAGGVALGLHGVDAVAEAARRMRARADSSGWRVQGFLVEEMLSGGQELVIGGLRDDRFGPIVMVGVGGVLVELLPELTFRIAPVTELEAIAMVRDVRVIRLLLEGARGRPPLSEEALVEVLLKIGGEQGLLIEHSDEVASIEINPLLLTPDSAVALDARIEMQPLTGRRVAHVAPSHEDFRTLLAPRTVAVVGASATRQTLANTFIRHLRDYGYQGRVFPVHPSAEQVEGLPAIPSLAAARERIDYVYVAVPPDQVAPVLSDAAGRLGFVQVISSGFGEVASGRDREAALVAAVRRSGAHLLGPNCLGTHSPRGRLTYLDGPSAQVGSVAIVSQSGGLTLDMVSLGRRLGIEFSGVVTVGNSADVTPGDLLGFFSQDPLTRVIGLYLEDVKYGRPFFYELRRATRVKPVVLLVGGQTEAGGRAATSHTGALASGQRVWAGLAAQTGAVLTDTLDGFLESLAAFQSLLPHRDRVTSRVALFGTGGGMSVLATDYLSRLGFSVPRLPDSTLRLLDELRLPPGSSLVNPIDTPSGTMRAENGATAAQIARLVLTTADLDALLVHLNLAAFLSFTDSEPDLFERLIDGIAEAHRGCSSRAHLLVVFRSSGEPEFETVQRRAIEHCRSLGLAAFTRIEGAAQGLVAVRSVEEVAVKAAAAGAPPGAASARELAQRSRAARSSSGPRTQ